MKSSKVVMNKVKHGMEDLEQFPPAMKNAELILVDFIYALLKKFTQSLDLKIMR